MSLVLHGTLFLILFHTLRGDGGGPGPREDDSRVVGIVVKDAQDAVAAGINQPAEDPTNQGQRSAQTPAASDKPSQVPGAGQVPTLSDTPPVPLDLPNTALTTIGPGALVPPGGAGQQSTDILKHRAGSGNLQGGSSGLGGGGGGPPGLVRFFDAQTEGKKIIYVIDGSGSMGSHLAINVAKAELIASLQKLTPEHHFQVVFYTSSPALLVAHRDGLSFQAEPEETLDDAPKRPGPPRQWLAATQINRTLSQQTITSFREHGGTNHLLALELALSLKPDVLFFLTDADEPELTMAELNTIRSRNPKGEIHTVEFGKGARINVDNFLVKIARQNRGTYSYRDVHQFQAGSR